MANASFDPDKYLAEKTATQPFDPDKYLAEKGASQESFMDRLGKGFGGLQEMANRGKKEYDIANPPSFDQNNEGAAAIHGMANAGTFGYLPQLQAVARPAVYGIMNAATGNDVDPGSYVANRDKNIATEAVLKEKNPYAYGGGQVAGAVVSGLATAPLSLAGKAAGAIPFLSREAAGVVPQLAQAAAKGALYGGEYAAISNPGDVKGVVNPLQLSERVSAIPEGMRSGAEMGAGLNALGQGVMAAPKVGKKLMTAFLGPSENSINYYLKNSEAVNSASSMPDLKNKIDGVIGGLKEEIYKNKMSYDDAKDVIKALENDIRSANQTGAMEFKLNKSDLNLKLKDAYSELDSLVKQRDQVLKSVKAPLELADETGLAVKDLKKKIVEGSKAATESLQGSEGKIEMYDAFKAIKQAKENMSIAGVGAVTPQAQAAQKELDNLANSFGKLPNKISFSDAKKLIQQIDRSEQAVYNSGQFTDEVSNTFKDLRRALDEQLKKQNPQYAEMMKPVAENTRLHGEVVDKFGEKQKAISTLNRIGSDTASVDREMLSKLGSATGRNFDEPVLKYMEAQGQLKDPKALEIFKSNLPVSQKIAELEARAAEMARPDAQGKYADEFLSNTGLLGKKSEAQGLLAQREAALAASEAKAEPLHGMSELTSENKIKGLMQAKPGTHIELEKQFEALSKLSDTDFVKAVRDLQNKEAFQKGATNGSRNALMFGAAGTAIGSATGNWQMAVLGGSAGTQLGGMVDKFGPAMAKKILDGVISMGKSPSIQQIKNLQISPDAKNYLVQSLIRFQQENKK